MNDKIVIRGARENNLKNVDLTIPRDKLVVFTGLSGSGKSSLAFDTIYAEGQRRYVESLSSYARQFLGQMDKPDVDSIDGLSPAISIDQKTTGRNPRSTVGTVTEIHDYLRLLYARIGVPHCPKCGKEIKQQTIDQMVDQIFTLPEGQRMQVLAPIVRARKGEHVKLLEDARKRGYVRVRIDGELCEPMEHVTIDVPDEYVGAVVEKLGQRKGDLLEMNPSGSRMRIEYSIPTRCLFGYRSKFMTDTHGEGILNSIFDGYEPYRGDVPMRFTGSLIASENGETTTYGLFNCQERGKMFLSPGMPVYEGQVVGECPKMEDITLNPCKKKQLTAIRSAGADEKLLLTPPTVFSLEEAIEFIGEDELIEVTPQSLRIRKRILDTETRLKAQSRARKGLS